MITEEQVYKILRDIYAKVPKLWRESVIEEEDLTPTIMKVVDEAIDTPGISDEKKEHFRRLKDEGHFSRKKYKENPTVVNKINNFVNREINKAVKEGRLPNKKKLAELKELWKEQKKTS